MTFKGVLIVIFIVFVFPIRSFTQSLTNDELLTILDIKAFRVPSFPKKQWTIEIIPDSLNKGKLVPIDKVLSSKTTAVIAAKFDNDTTLSFTLIQNKDLSSQGFITLKQSRYEIEWNRLPLGLNKNTFVIASIKYEQNDGLPLENLNYLLVITLIDELRFGVR